MSRSRTRFTQADAARTGLVSARCSTVFVYRASPWRRCGIREAACPQWRDIYPNRKKAACWYSFATSSPSCFAESMMSGLLPQPGFSGHQPERLADLSVGCLLCDGLGGLDCVNRLGGLRAHVAMRCPAQPSPLLERLNPLVGRAS
jgi:hypothetical protein